MQTIILPSTGNEPVVMDMAEFYDYVAQLYREGRRDSAETLLDYAKSVRTKHIYG